MDTVPTFVARVFGVPLDEVFEYPEEHDMKAWVYDRYGSPDVLEWADVEAPSRRTARC